MAINPMAYESKDVVLDVVRTERGVVLRLHVEGLERIADEKDVAREMVVIGLHPKRGIGVEVARPARQQVVSAIAVAGKDVDIGVEQVALEREMIGTADELRAQGIAVSAPAATAPSRAATLSAPTRSGGSIR